MAEAFARGFSIQGPFRALEEGPKRVMVHHHEELRYSIAGERRTRALLYTFFAIYLQENRFRSPRSNPAACAQCL